MDAAVVVCLVWFMLVAIVGGLFITGAARLRTPRSYRRLRDRTAHATDDAIRWTGPATVTAIVLLAAWSAIIIVFWVLGVLAHRLETTVDRPILRWSIDHHLQGGWSRLWWHLTNIGSPEVTQTATVVAAAVFAALFWSRRSVLPTGRLQWASPSLILLLGYLAEKYSQMILKKVVDRGHPPTSLGSWPSGGCARVTTVYGLCIFFLVLYIWGRDAGPRVWAAAWTLLALVLSVQAYARLNNLEHWFTDVIGGMLYGVALLTMMTMGYRVLSRRPTTLTQPRTPPREVIEAVSPAR